MFYTVIIHESAPINALKPDGLRALNNGTFHGYSGYKTLKAINFVIPIVNKMGLIVHPIPFCFYGQTPNTYYW